MTISCQMSTAATSSIDIALPNVCHPYHGKVILGNGTMFSVDLVPRRTIHGILKAIGMDGLAVQWFNVNDIASDAGVQEICFVQAGLAADCTELVLKTSRQTAQMQTWTRQRIF